MEERINQALVQLESDLQGLLSAKEQVEKTVGASAELLETVGEYVASVNHLCLELRPLVIATKGVVPDLEHEVKSIIANIERTCSTIITTFNTNVDKAMTTFQTGVQNVLVKFIDENNKLSDHVKSLNSLREQIEKATGEIQLLKESLSQISEDLKESQKSQDEVLDAIKEDVGKIANTTSSTVKGYIDEQTSKIEALLAEKDIKIQELSSTISSVKQVCNDIKEISSSINPAIIQKIEECISLNSTKAEELQQNIKASVNNVAHQSIINRWIIIAGIIILAALQFI